MPTVEESPVAMVSKVKPIDSGLDRPHLRAKIITSHNSLFPIHCNPKITPLQRARSTTRVALEAAIFFCSGGKGRGPEDLGPRVERWQMRHHLRQNRRSRFTGGWYLGWRRERHRRPCRLLVLFPLIIGPQITDPLCLSEKRLQDLRSAGMQPLDLCVLPFHVMGFV